MTSPVSTASAIGTAQYPPQIEDGYTTRCESNIMTHSCPKQCVAEIIQNTRGQPHSLWAISLADVKGGGFERDVPGVERAGIDLVSHSNPRHARMVCPACLLFECLFKIANNVSVSINVQLGRIPPIPFKKYRTHMGC